MKVRGGELSGASFPGTGHVDASRDRAAQLTGHGRLVRGIGARTASLLKHASTHGSFPPPDPARSDTALSLFPCQLPLKWR